MHVLPFSSLFSVDDFDFETLERAKVKERVTRSVIAVCTPGCSEMRRLPCEPRRPEDAALRAAASLGYLREDLFLLLLSCLLVRVI